MTAMATGLPVMVPCPVTTASLSFTSFPASTILSSYGPLASTKPRESTAPTAASSSLNEPLSSTMSMRSEAVSLSWKLHFGQTFRLVFQSSLGTCALHPLHLVQMFAFGVALRSDLVNQPIMDIVLSCSELLLENRGGGWRARANQWMGCRAGKAGEGTKRKPQHRSRPGRWPGGMMLKNGVCGQIHGFFPPPRRYLFRSALPRKFVKFHRWHPIARA